MADVIRQPKQKRAIEKKNKIIEAGYQLFAADGYFNTNTEQIAKKAGVSTGILYSYFHDKLDVLVEVLDIYVNNVYLPIVKSLEKLDTLNFDEILPNVLDNVVCLHKENHNMHEALHSLTASVPVVNDKFIELQDQVTKRIATKLVDLGYNLGNVFERVHLAVEIVQLFSHECVFDNHAYIDYQSMKSIVLKMLKDLFVHQ